MERSKNFLGILNWIILLAFICTAASAMLMVPDRVATALKNLVGTFELAATGVIWSLGIVLPVALVTGLIIAIRVGFQFARATCIKVDLREWEANTKITVADPGQQVYITEKTPRTTSRPLHLAPGRVNGGQAVFDADEWRAWQMDKLVNATARRNRAASGPADLPQIGQTFPDLLAQLDNAQRCLIVGASDTGKTTLLHHIMERRYGQSKVIVIDPHSSPQKWAGHTHKCFGIGRNYADIDRGLDLLLELMLKRYDEIGRGLAQEGTHSKITVLVDEWRAITSNVPNSAEAIKTLLTESRKAAFSMFIASHSERARPLGLAGEYDLKDGFTVVRLSIQDGQRAATLDHGEGPIPVALPGPYVAHQGALLPGDQVDFDRQPDPTPEEAKILALASEGLSNAQICQAVWGYKSSNRYPDIDRVIEKFNQT